MRGIFQGLGLTLSHLARPKVTRMYPYEKPRLPARSRGLIELIQEDRQQTPYNLRCEACLLCEKVCPPRAITIEYRPTHRFRQRPYFSERGRAAFYTPRISEYATAYAHRPIAAVVATPTTVALEEPVDLTAVDTLLAQSPLDPQSLSEMLGRVMDIYGGMPLAVARRIVAMRGVDLSDLYGIVTAMPNFRPWKARTPGILRDDNPERGPSAATRGKFANINHERGPTVTDLHQTVQTTMH